MQISVDRARRPPLLRAFLPWHVAMAAAAVWPPSRSAAVAGVMAFHGLLVAGCLIPRSSWVGENLCRLPRSASRRRVVLTFDDGPDPRVTPAVLDRLDAAGAQASFFCVGRAVEAHPDLAREVVARGHRVENHTHSHHNLFSLLSPSAMRREIVETQSAIQRITGRVPRYFRAPAGFKSPWLGRLLAESGLTLVTWTRRGFDTVSRSVPRILGRLTRSLREGDILLLHDRWSNSSAGTGGPPVLGVLPELLASLEARGFRAMALPAEGVGDGE